MKKLLAIAILGGVIGLAACTEKGPLIDFSVKQDSTYVSSTVETPQARNVLIEEFTGVSCANCPKGHQTIAASENAHPGHVIAVGLYEFGPSTTEPLTGLTVQDLRTKAATDIASNIYGGVSSLPTAGIDRVPVSGNYQIDRALWGTTIDGRATVPTKANVDVTSSFNASDSTVDITVKVAFTDSVAKDLIITGGITEDSIVEAQEDQTTFDTIYVQNHILRDVFTQATGDNFLSDVTTKEPGRVYIRRYKYQIPSGSRWVLNHCKIFAFVSTVINVNDPNSTKEVLQAAETKL